MLTSAPGVAFLPSTDLERAQDFFGGRLGLVVEEATPFACTLRAGEITLRVTKVDELRVQPFTVFGWQVPDIRRVVAELAAAGVRCVHFDGMEQDDAGIWTAPNGDRVAWFHDPDGNVLSLNEPVATG